MTRTVKAFKLLSRPPLRGLPLCAVLIGGGVLSLVMRAFLVRRRGDFFGDLFFDTRSSRAISSLDGLEASYIDFGLVS